LQLSSTRFDRMGCIKQAPPATLMPPTLFNPHLPRSSGGVLTQPRLLPAYGQVRGCASRIERILDITLMSVATSLACYWPFDWPLATSNRYQRGRAPHVRLAQPPRLRPCCGKTRQSKRPSSIIIVHSRINGNLVCSLFIYLEEPISSGYPAQPGLTWRNPSGCGQHNRINLFLCLSVRPSIRL
jgi:hypothetical protein